MTYDRPEFNLEPFGEERPHFKWTWAGLPRRPLSGHPTQFPGFRVSIADGREIILMSMNQSLVHYPLSLTPILHHPESHVLSAIRQAKKMADWVEEAPPVVLPPTLFELTYVRSQQLSSAGGEADLGPGDKALTLPRVQVIAHFYSESGAKDASEVYSEVIAIWFQDNFGAIPDDIQMQLAGVDWKNSAYGWSP